MALNGFDQLSQTNRFVNLRLPEIVLTFYNMKSLTFSCLEGVLVIGIRTILKLLMFSLFTSSNSNLPGLSGVVVFLLKLEFDPNVADFISL